MVLVCQDAGHGGIDNGASSKGLIEKNLTLEASMYVHKRLEELGIDSTCTRTTDATLKKGNDNSIRTNKVKNSGASICYSHHYNAGGGNGAETIYSIYDDGKLANMILDEFKAIGHPVRKAFTRKYGNGDYYFMHRDTGKVKTVIIEYDFLDNPKNDNIKSKAYREKLYEAVVKATCKYLGVKYTESKPVNKTVNKKTMYRVVTGSFSDKDNADVRVAELKKKGFDSFIDVYEV